jgi:hypothetical protein
MMAASLVKYIPLQEARHSFYLGDASYVLVESE